MSKLREAPLFYVVDATATLVFASESPTDAASSDVLQLMLRAAVAAAKAGATGSPLMWEGRLIRCERLATSGDGERYAVFLERIAAEPPAFGGTVLEEIDISEDQD